MAVEFSGIRNVIKYIQTEEPTDQIVGDMWYKPNFGLPIKTWDGYLWVSIPMGTTFGG